MILCDVIQRRRPITYEVACQATDSVQIASSQSSVGAQLLVAGLSIKQIVDQVRSNVRSSPAEIAAMMTKGMHQSERQKQMLLGYVTTAATAEQNLAKHLTRYLDVASYEDNREAVHEMRKEINNAYHRFLPADDVERHLELKQFNTG